MGVESGPQMTPECAVAKMMLCLAYRDLTLSSWGAVGSSIREEIATRRRRRRP
jgi:hypothetical protein